MSNALEYQGKAISFEAEIISLTDMWKAAGSDPSKRPAYWLRQDATVEFIEHLKSNVIQDHIDLVVTERGGTSPGTWTHWQIAMAYGKYLSPEFHAWCNTVVRQHFQGKSPSPPRGLNAIERINKLESKLEALVAEGLMTKRDALAISVVAFKTELGFDLTVIPPLVITRQSAATHTYISTDGSASTLTMETKDLSKHPFSQRAGGETMSELMMKYREIQAEYKAVVLQSKSKASKLRVLKDPSAYYAKTFGDAARALGIHPMASGSYKPERDGTSLSDEMATILTTRAPVEVNGEVKEVNISIPKFSQRAVDLVRDYITYEIKSTENAMAQKTQEDTQTKLKLTTN